jgi:hypothetical protein
VKKDEILDRLVSYRGGGVATDETYPNRQYFASKLESMREFALREEFRRDNVISEVYYQNHYLVYDEDINECSEKCGAKFYAFEVPDVLRIDSRMGGFGYVGSRSMEIPYEFYPSIERFSTAMGNRISRKNIRRGVVAFYDNSEKVMYISAGVKNGLVRGIFRSPESIPTFNVDADDYPISGKGLEILEEAIRSGSLNIMLRQPQDKLPNSQTDVDLIRSGFQQPR